MTQLAALAGVTVANLSILPAPQGETTHGTACLRPRSVSSVFTGRH